MVLGVEIGGTKLQLGVCDRRGHVKTLKRLSVNRPDGAAGILKQIEEIAPVLLERRASSRPFARRGHDRAWPSRIKAIGVGFGGPVDVETGRAVRSHQIAGWEDFPVRQWFARKFRLPVFVENDQNCAAFAEAKVGAGKGKRKVFYVTVGTGIGGGLVVDGEIYNGRYGAAEIGHTLVPAELTTSKQRSLPVSCKLVTLESVGSGLAVERGVSTVAQAGRYVGVAIANAIALLNPDIIIVGGGVALNGEQFFRPLRAAVRRHVFPVFRDNCRIVPPALGQHVVVVGAALYALSRLR